VAGIEVKSVQKPTIRFFKSEPRKPTFRFTIFFKNRKPKLLSDFAYWLKETDDFVANGSLTTCLGANFKNDPDVNLHRCFRALDHLTVTESLDVLWEITKLTALPHLTECNTYHGESATVQ